ncbi:GNAT family N-acetyltransferase [Clostridium sp. UBA5988]|uniref:GNAT family N-acetyltransferase n=1 Tax=Clostridium sp. UBA5988 TaxID=1946369 RepID=UPI003216CC21
MNLHVREAIRSDYIEINNLVKEVHNLHVENRPDVYVNTDTPLIKEDFYELLSTSDTKVFVVEDLNNKELVAYSIVKIMAHRSIQILRPMTLAYIDDFCVKASKQKNGIGRLLFDYVVSYAKSEGALSLQLIVWEFNKDAIKFYESLGMTVRNRRMELNLS